MATRLILAKILVIKSTCNKDIEKHLRLQIHIHKPWCHAESAAMSRFGLYYRQPRTAFSAALNVALGRITALSLSASTRK